MANLQPFQPIAFADTLDVIECVVAGAVHAVHRTPNVVARIVAGRSVAFTGPVWAAFVELQPVARQSGFTYKPGLGDPGTQSAGQ